MAAITQIDSSKVEGEPGTGFEKRGNKGPFNCGNCEYFSMKNGAPGACGQETMMARSRYPRWPDGTVVIDAYDCCEYVKRIGKFWIE